MQLRAYQLRDYGDSSSAALKISSENAVVQKTSLTWQVLHRSKRERIAPGKTGGKRSIPL